METRILKKDLPEIKKLAQEAREDASDILALIENPKVAEGGFKEILTGFLLMGSLLSSGNAQASAKDFSSLVNGLSKISSHGVSIKSHANLQGNQGNFKIVMGPYTIEGTFRG